MSEIHGGTPVSISGVCGGRGGLGELNVGAPAL